MTLLDMQRVFSRILTDKEFQRSFSKGEEPASATYQLTERELESLRGLRWDRVGLHAELLAHSRLELALKALPLTSLLLGKQLHEQLDRFCAEYPPTPQAASAVLVEATRLCDFASKLIGEGVLKPAWAADVIRYERILVALATSFEAAASAIRVTELNAEEGWPPSSPGDLVPVTGPHAEVAWFSYPLPDLLPVLQDGGVPDDVRPLERPLLILFHKSPRGPVQVVRINEATAVLIESCDGDRTIAGVAERLSCWFGPSAETRARVIAAIGWLRDNGVAGLRKRS
jgi:hypothetical protein